MADIFDQTDECVEIERVPRNKQKPKPTSLDCVDCGNRIPASRQVQTGGTELCELCESNEEHLGRHYR